MNAIEKKKLKSSFYWKIRFEKLNLQNREKRLFSSFFFAFREKLRSNRKCLLAWNVFEALEKSRWFCPKREKTVCRVHRLILILKNTSILLHSSIFWRGGLTSKNFWFFKLWFKVSVVLNWDGFVRNKVTLGTSMVRVAFDADIRIEGNLLAISLMLFYFLVSHANGQTVWNSQQQPDMFTKKKGNHNMAFFISYIFSFLFIGWPQKYGIFSR